MLHAQNATPLQRQCRTVIFLERLIAFSEFLHITYTKTTILIKRSFGTPCGFHELTRQQRGSGAAAALHSVHPALRFHSGNLRFASFEVFVACNTEETTWNFLFL
jgi:hypothetical protein